MVGDQTELKELTIQSLSLVLPLEEKPNERPYFDTVPKDVLNLIANNLNGRDIASLSCTCKYFYNHFNDNELWKKIYFKEFLPIYDEVEIEQMKSSWKQSYQ